MSPRSADTLIDEALLTGESHSGQAKAAIAYLGGLLALVLAFFWRLVTPDGASRWFIALGDLTRQFYPYHAFAAAELHSGRVPLWNPYIFAGHPFLADIQTAFFYPPGFLINLAFGADGLTLAEVQYRVVLAYLMAATFTFLFVRALTKSNGASLVSAIAFTLGGFLTSYPMQQLPVLETSLWLPLILLFVHRAIGSRRWLRETLGATLALACAILAGHPQTLLYVGYTVAGFALFEILSTRIGERAGASGTVRRMAGGVGKVALATTLALALCAVQLLPSLELMSLSNRSVLSYELASGGYKATTWLAALLPNWPEGRSIYLGLLVLALAVIAVARSSSPARWFWAATAALAALLSLGANGPLYPLFYSYAPGFSLFRSQERAIFIYSFAVSVLTGLGAAALADRASPGPDGSPRLFRALVPVVALLGVALLVRNAPGSGEVGAQLLATLALAAASYWLLRHDTITVLGRKRWLVVVAVFAAVDLFSVNFGHNLTPEYSGLSASAEEAAQMIKMDAAERGISQYRVRVQTDDEEVFPTNYAQLLGQPQAAGDTPFYQERFANLRQANNEWRFWEIMNVVYTVSRRELRDGTRLVGTAGEFRVYRMQHPVARVWAVRDVRLARSPEEALALSFQPDTGPGRVAVVENAPSLSFADTTVPAQTHTLVEYSPQRLAYDVKLESDALLVLSEAYYPGWRAWVDGVETPIFTVHYYLRGLVVPAGRHRVEMGFAPESFGLGAMISAGTALVLTLIALGYLIPRAIARRHPQGE